MYRNNLRALRSERNITQVELSKALEIGQAEYSRIEAGKRKIYPHKVKIAEFLKISESDIIETSNGNHVDRPALAPTLPVFGFPLPDGKGFDFTQQMMSKVDRPAGCSNYKAYACFCFGDHLKPQINNGDIAFVNPYLEPREGGLVVVRFDANGKERGLLCQFSGTKAGKIVVSLGDDEEVFDEAQCKIEPVVSVQYAL